MIVIIKDLAVCMVTVLLNLLPRDILKNKGMLFLSISIFLLLKASTLITIPEFGKRLDMKPIIT